MVISTGSSHYKGGTIEPLELIEAQGLDFHLGNVVKYVVRAHFYSKRKKTKARAHEAIDKAKWYLERWKELHV